MIGLNRSAMRKFIGNLNAKETSQVLRDLLDDDPALTKIVYDIAAKVTANVDADEVMEDVFRALDSLDMDDLNSRSGRTRYGYVAPYDAAREMFEEALYPFIGEMKKNLQRALPSAAKAYCVGIVKGLRKYEKESSSDIKDWVTDAPGEYIDTIVKEWKKGNPDDAEIAEVTSATKSERKRSSPGGRSSFAQRRAHCLPRTPL
jgi:hypothetical protein